MNFEFYAQMSVRILALLAIVQGFEFLSLSKVVGRHGVWRGADLEPEFVRSGSAFAPILRIALNENSFVWMNWLRILVAVTQLVSPSASGVFLLTVFHLLTMLRWLGAFNGGSDFMALLVLMGAGLALATGGKIATLGLWYIAAQLILSYVKAGWVKIRNSEWRNGYALGAFLRSSIYETDRLSGFVTDSGTWLKCASWAVMIFELTFPLSLLGPRVAIFYLSVGLLFHLANAYFLGLNRFILAWVAAYPALCFAVQ